jgi:hypothetical protein
MDYPVKPPKRYQVFENGNRVDEVYAASLTQAARAYAFNKGIDKPKLFYTEKDVITVRWTDLRGAYENPPRTELEVTIRRQK